MTVSRLIASQRRVLAGRWYYVHPPLLEPRWWQFWKHRHRHRMTFPRDDHGHELDWRFVCECGHTTDNIDQAQP